MLSPRQFARVQQLALQWTGIELHDRHRELLGHRGRRAGLPDEAAWDALLEAFAAGQDAARQQFVGLVTTQFTAFFRHPWHFEAAARHALEAVRQRGEARLWSAAAATGQEPYSLAIALLEAFAPQLPPCRILATDLDQAPLDLAARGEFPEAAVAAMEPERRARFCTPAGPHRWRVVPEVRELVEFRPLNLVDAAWPVTGPFDVIFCRNVLMYFEAAHRYAVLERMASVLADDGLLLLDPSEHPGNAGHWFTHGARGIYARRRGLPPSRGLPARRSQPVS